MKNLTERQISEIDILSTRLYSEGERTTGVTSELLLTFGSYLSCVASEDGAFLEDTFGGLEAGLRKILGDSLP